MSGTLDDGVDDGTPPTGFGCSNEEEVLLSNGSGSHGVFDLIIMYAMKRYRKSPGGRPGQRCCSSWKHRGRWRKVTTALKYSRKRPPWEVSVPCRPQCNVNTEQASKCCRRNRPAIITGKVAVCGRSEQIALTGPTGVVVVACRGRMSCRTWETCQGETREWLSGFQQPARKGVVWLRQAADEGVVVMMPGNAGGAKAL